jgi:hypothetical protein
MNSFEQHRALLKQIHNYRTDQLNAIIEKNLIIAKQFDPSSSGAIARVERKYFPNSTRLFSIAYRLESTNKLHGPYIQYFASGQIHDNWFYNGNRIHGLRTTWYPDGMYASSMEYENGFQCGKSFYWTNSGLLHTSYYHGKQRDHKKLLYTLKQNINGPHNYHLTDVDNERAERQQHAISYPGEKYIFEKIKKYL